MPRQVLLSQEIASAINALGSNTLDLGALKGVLMRLKAEAIAIENGQPAKEFEAEAAILKAQIECLKAVNKSELEERETVNKAQRDEMETQKREFEAILEKTTAEINRLREAENQKEGENEAVSSIERRILFFLDVEGCVWSHDIRDLLKFDAFRCKSITDELVSTGFVKEVADEFDSQFSLTKKAKKWIEANRAGY